jgi:hypothetical protein
MMLRNAMGLLLLSVAVATTLGCGDKKAAKCQIGEVLDCKCPDRTASVRACRPDGSWGACQCGTATAGTVAGTVSTAGTVAGGGGMSGMGAAGMVADAGPVDSSVADATTDSDAAMDGSIAGEDATVPDPYSMCVSGACPGGEICSESGNYCTKECMAAADCSAPSDGTVTATKTCSIPLGMTKGKCALACTILSKCPAGMTCGISSECGY